MDADCESMWQKRRCISLVENHLAIHFGRDDTATLAVGHGHMRSAPRYGGDASGLESEEKGRGMLLSEQEARRG